MIGILALFTMPIAIGIAILRYRLYDIDRIISRTLGYVVITARADRLLCSARASVLGGPLARASPAGDTVAVALSTLVVAALFQPLRRRVQPSSTAGSTARAIDAERTAAAFAGRLRDQVDIDDRDGRPRRDRPWRASAEPSSACGCASTTDATGVTNVSRQPASRNDSRTPDHAT